MNIQGQSQKYGHLIVAGGTLIALIGFFFLPYVTLSSKAASSSSSSSSSSAVAYSGIQAASIQGFIWLDALLAVAILLVALLLAYSHNPFGMSQLALDKRVQRGIYTIIGVGVVSVLLQYILMASIPGAIAGMFSSNYAGYATGVSSSSNNIVVGYNSGSWVFLVGMLVVIGGAVYALMLTRSTSVAQAPSSPPYMPPTQYPPMYPQNQQVPMQQPPSAPSYQQNWQQSGQSAQSAQPPQGPWQAPQDQTQRAWQPPQPGQPQQPQQPPTEYPPTQRSWPQQPPQSPYPPS